MTPPAHRKPLALADLAAQPAAGPPPPSGEEAGDPLLGVTLGSYRLQARLGQGTKGVVYLAADVVLGRTAAVKVLAPAPDADPEAAAGRFLAEARAAARLDHPNCLGAYACGQEQGVAYLAMPLVQGVSAQERLTLQGLFGPLEATRVCKLAARGLAAAHTRDLVHGQLRPGKLLLGAQSEVKVIGFALPAAAPQKLATQADLTDLCSVYYTLLTGRPATELVVPSAGPASGTPARPRVPADVPPACVEIFDRVFSDPPTFRYRTALELAAALDQVEILLRRPVSGAESETLPVRRRARPTGVGPGGPLAGLRRTRTLGPGTDLGKYLLEEKVGQSASSVVYRALHKGLNIPVAVKVLQFTGEGVDAGVHQQLKSEACLLAQFNHPNIVRVWDFEGDADSPYLVMEYVEGRTLAGLIEEKGRLTPEEVLPIIAQVAEGLAAAYKLGIVHRDVKPGNVLLANDGTAKIADLGLALVVNGGGLAVPGGPEAPDRGVAGTAAYIAPEQAVDSRTSDHRSDIYALGATLFHALTGRFPFEGRSPWEVVLKHLKEPLWLPPELRSGPARVATELILKMMAKKPQERFQSYEELLAALAALQAPREGGDGPRKGSGVTRLGGLTGRERLTLKAHQGEVLWAAFSRDGSILATASWDQSVKLWDPDKGREWATLHGHAAPVWFVGFTGQDKHLATGSGDPADPQRRGEVKLWDVASGQGRTVLRGLTSTITSVAFSPDGKALTAGSGDGTLRVLSVLTGQGQATFKAHTSVVAAVAYSPDGTLLATGGWDRLAKLWDPVHRRERAVLHGHADSVRALAFSPDGQVLATGSWDGTVRLWHVGTGREVLVLRGHTDSVRTVAFRPGGRTLASGSGDGTVKLWGAADGKEGATLRGHAGPVTSLAFAPDGLTLATASADRTVRLWDVVGQD